MSLSGIAGTAVTIRQARPVSGGCINNGTKLETNSGSFFMKSNDISAFPNFQAEQKGLELLRQHSAFTIPEVYFIEKASQEAIMVMEWLEPGPGMPDFWEQFGMMLSEMHQVSQPEFGLDHDNYIGTLPQSNQPHPDWTSFFIHERLNPQLLLAEKAGLIDSTFRQSFEILYKKLAGLIPDEDPALLHGDLWSGNFLRARLGTPALIDPAVYYGHREAEIAFTRLFGGFDRRFYEAYNSAGPLVPGWEERVPLFNLYPLMVHLNLFGQSYLPEIQNSLKLYL